jgi:cellulose synthase/poly-beta-1,6-N-acetylglucosamine synthase-like glycosyltransferase
MHGNLLNTLLVALGWMLVAAAAPGSIELAILTLGGLLPVRRRPACAGRLPRTAIVIPAHNEETGIARTIASVCADTGGDPDVSVIVIADNCTDATADRARSAGARVLIRHDPAQRGKGYALDFAFRRLLAEGFEAFIVVDADTRVSPGSIQAIRSRIGAGADAVQCRYTVANAEASVRTRLMNVALLAFNVMRPRGRDRFGMSCGILGNGFALRRETLIAVPYEAGSVVEDLEYHLRLVRAGKKVEFADEASVRGDMPERGSGVATQRARWEGGRFRMIAEWTMPISREVLSGRLRLLEPLMELLLMPLAFHMCLLILALFAPDRSVRVAALAQIALAGIHVVASALRCGGGAGSLLALAAAPFYVLWKVAMLGAMFRSARRNAAWVRTARAGADGGKP